MAKEVNKRVNIWLNQQGIDNNLKSIRAAITKKEAHRTGQIQLPRHANHEHLWNADATIAPSPERSREKLGAVPVVLKPET